MSNKFKKKHQAVRKYTKVPSLYLGSIFDMVLSAHDCPSRELYRAMKMSVKYQNMPCEYYIVKDTAKAVSIIESNDTFRFTVTTGTLKQMLDSLRETITDKNRDLFYNFRHLNDAMKQPYNGSVKFVLRADSLELDEDECESNQKLTYDFRRPYMTEGMCCASMLIDVLWYMHEGNHQCLGSISKLKFWDTYRADDRDYSEKIHPRICSTISQRLEPTRLMAELIDTYVNFEKPDWRNNPEHDHNLNMWNSQTDDLYKYTNLANTSKNIIADVSCWKTLCKTVNLIDEITLGNISGVAS